MIWIIIAAFAGVVVVGVSAWARGERRKVDAEGAARRQRSQSDAVESRLLDKLRTQRDESEG